MAAGGSPQLFQTGETYKGLPISEFQHPHDLVMGLGATYEQRHERLSYFIGADLVGSPTLGPVAFMHRASAMENRVAPARRGPSGAPGCRPCGGRSGRA